MKNKYNFCILKVYLLSSEHCQLKKCLCLWEGIWSFFQKNCHQRGKFAHSWSCWIPPRAEWWPMLPSAWHTESRAEQSSSHSHYQRMGNLCSNSCRVFHFLEGKAQPCSTPALPGHPSLPSLFSFPSSFSSMATFPSLLMAPFHPSCASLARPCAALACPLSCCPQEQELTALAVAAWPITSSHRCIPAQVPGQPVSTLYVCGAPELLLYSVLFYNGSISHSNAADLPYCISLFLIRFCSLFLSPFKAEAIQNHGCSLC